MRLLLSRNLITHVAKRWAGQYPVDNYGPDNPKGKIREALEALDTSTATAAEVAEIIGNKSWSYITCEECSQPVEQAVEFSQEYSEGKTTFCPSCLRAAAALASVVLPVTGLTFYAERGVVYMADGPWSAKLNQAQCDALLDLWDEVGAVTAFNRLYDAVQAAGYFTPVLTTRALRRPPVLVVDNTPDVAAHNFTQAMEQSL